MASTVTWYIFDATTNPLLTCIQVDDPSYMNANWSAGKDAGATYSTVCPLPCIVNIPDTAFKNALLADTLINTNGDGEIQCAEATSFTGVISVSSLAISDLTGIGAFINITGLNCSNNNLLSLDVSTNLNLVNLNCAANKWRGSIQHQLFGSCNYMCSRLYRLSG
ncbi:MAG: hypothetical protein IPO27_05725 [Bacteroidetes bacterium]|nr:hypothetical protein [Bacteroidota bacterium]